MFMVIIKKIVIALSILYALNIFISSAGIIIPINIYTVLIVSIFDFVGVVMLFIIKLLL